MSKAYREFERRLNRELAQKDAQNRCTLCKRNLNEVGVIVEDFLLEGKFCSDACLKQYRSRPARGLSE